MTQDEVYQWLNANRNLLSQEELMGISRQGGGGDDGGYTPWDYGDIQQKAINPALLRKYGLPATLGGNQELKEINGQLYTAVNSGNEPGWGLPGKGYLSAENFFNDSTPELAAQRQDALSKMVEQDGRQWIPIQNYASAQKSMEPFNNKKSGFDNFLESLFSAGPLIASSALAGGALSGFNGLSPSIWESLGIQNPFSGLSNLFGGDAGGGTGSGVEYGSGGSPSLQSFYEAAGYTPEQIASLQSSIGSLGISDASLLNWNDPDFWSNVDGGKGGGTSGTDPKTSGSSSFADYLKLAGGGSSLLGKLLASGLGAYSANKQAGTLQDLSNQFASYGAPYRYKLADLYSNPAGFLNSPEVQIPVQQGTDALARSLSIKGNPAGSGNALQQLQSYSADQLFGRLGQEKDRLAGFGGLAAYNAAAPQVANSAVNAQGGTLGAIGGGIADVFNPPKTAAQQMAELMKVFGG